MTSSGAETSAAAQAVACPNCGAGLVNDYAAAPWCERCEWGLDVYEPPSGTSWLGRQLGAVSHRIAYRITMRYFRKVHGAAITRPGWSGPKVMIVVLAIVFYAFIAALAAAGAWLVLFDFPNLTIVPGLLLLGIAAVLAPRFGRLRADDDVIGRDEAPELFGLVDRVAAAAGAGVPKVIVLDADISAAATSVGLRRRRVLRLGMALWGSLSPQ